MAKVSSASWLMRAGILAGLWILGQGTYRMVFGPRVSGHDFTPMAIERDPVQEAIAYPVVAHFQKGGYDWVMTPLASYSIEGVVLGEHTYHFDWNSMLSPCDVAIAWGPLTRNDLYRKLHWSQGQRWVYWRYGPDFDFDNTFVARYSSNNHIVPATPNVARAAEFLTPGEHVELSGELISLEGHQGERSLTWTSSLSREDQGDGACELLYLRRVRVGQKVYE